MIWRWLGLFVATLSLTWLVLLWRLQNRSDIPEGVLWVYFAGLPLLVFGLLAGFIWAFRRAYATSQNKHKPAAQAAADADVGSGPAAEANTRQAPALAVAVLYAGARNMAGAQAAEILDGLREGKLFPAPDAELLSWAGMPVVTARIAELEAELETLTPALGGEGASASFSDIDDTNSDNTHAPTYVLRSAAALKPLLHEAFATVGQWPAAGAVADASQEEDTSAYHSALLRPVREQSACSVHVLAAVDEEWPAHSVHSLSRWLEQAVHEQGQQAACAVSFELVHGSAALWQAGRDFVQARHAQLACAGGGAQPHSYLLLLASHSDLDEEWVALYENKGILFSAQDNPRGRIPGEGAAALLLHVGTGVGGQAESTEQAAQRAWGPLLYWPEVRRANQAAGAADTNSDTGDTSNGAGGAPDRTPSGHTPANGAGDASGVLADGMQSALQTAGVAAASVASLCSDADRHSRQATELFGMTWAVLPQLDPLEHIGMAGVSGGHMGAAASVLACALAVEATSQRQAPCAFAGVQDAQVRVAGCVVPQGWAG